MNDELAWLDALAGRPHDETLRGAYADWLDEGELPGAAEKAEFLRLESGLAVAGMAAVFRPLDAARGERLARLRGDLPAGWVVRVEGYRRIDDDIDTEGRQLARGMVDLLAGEGDVRLPEGLEFHEPFRWMQRASVPELASVFHNEPRDEARPRMPFDTRTQLGRRMTGGWCPVLVLELGTERLQRLVLGDPRPPALAGPAAFARVWLHGALDRLHPITRRWVML